MKVAIVGAGIGGLSAALCLRSRGIEPTVYEQAPQLGEVGAALRITPNVTGLLKDLGLGDALESLSTRTQRLAYRRWKDGSELATLELGDSIEQRYGAPYYHVHRADLHWTLVDRLPLSSIHLGHRCIGISQTPDGVQIEFENRSTAIADVVIGADGIHSFVRSHVMGPDMPRFSGDISYRALVPAERLPGIVATRTQNVWLGPDRHFVQNYAGPRFVNFVALVPGRELEESWSAEGDINELRREFDGWDPLLTSIINAADKVMYWTLYDREPLERWSAGRVVLLGDAAHPMLPYLGQGAVQAIEDAALLARCLADAPDCGVETSLERYVTIRSPRTSRIQLGARDVGALFHLPDGEAQKQRDATFKEKTAEHVRRNDWLFSYNVLNDYDERFGVR